MKGVMSRTEQFDEELEPVDQSDDGFDLEEERLEISEMADGEDELEGSFLEDPQRRIENADVDNALDEFIEVVNGRDMDGLAELLAPDAEAGFLDEYSRDGVVSGFNDLLMRNPTTIVTRADFGMDPIAALWAYDREIDGFDPFGYLIFELSETEDGLIQRVDYVEDVGDPDDLVVEVPERSELPEWWDWSAFDED
jgi:hypothetical protein